jgi:8-oxo-dGTP pyrophosphatase MutT (NUDIX family)
MRGAQYSGGVETSWDGLPIARDKPFACVVIVWRDGLDRREFLLLHRLAPGGAGYEGDWAWTPPAGARQPGEAPTDAARRELLEETGLALPLRPLPGAAVTDEVELYAAHAPASAQVVLDAEHDRFAWLPLDEAAGRCLPPLVAAGLRNAVALLASSPEPGTPPTATERP